MAAGVTRSTRAPSQVYYFSFCKVAIPDEASASEPGSSAMAIGGAGDCSVIFTPEELEKTSYRKMDTGEDDSGSSS
ncbi:hypothetical protein [Methanofollis ethanolicus]|uniref:hypothetical protein n=1 Tax=Methanofollis ethanolicus TaxID=488124 RepID=UPI00082A5F8B|nr:hypothetical protein [Methanofollis ethanolicus]